MIGIIRKLIKRHKYRLAKRKWFNKNIFEFRLQANSSIYKYIEYEWDKLNGLIVYHNDTHGKVKYVKQIGHILKSKDPCKVYFSLKNILRKDEHRWFSFYEELEA